MEYRYKDLRPIMMMQLALLAEVLYRQGYSVREQEALDESPPFAYLRYKSDKASFHVEVIPTIGVTELVCFANGLLTQKFYTLDNGVTESIQKAGICLLAILVNPTSD